MRSADISVRAQGYGSDRGIKALLGMRVGWARLTAGQFWPKTAPAQRPLQPKGHTHPPRNTTGLGPLAGLKAHGRLGCTP